jgi:hypothetical protein
VLGGLGLERLLFGGHNAFERCQAGTRNTFVDGEDSRQGKVDRLRGTLEVPTGGSVALPDIQL